MRASLLFLLFFLFFKTPGFAEQQGVFPDYILLGTSLPLSGHASYLGHEVMKGMEAYFKFVNEQGGVWGRKIVLKAYDDRYNPPLMIGNVRTLVEEDKVFALISLVGTPTTLTVLKYCELNRVPILFPITGAIELRRPVWRYVFNLRPSYWDECRVAVDYFIKKGKKRFAVFYQQDAYGFNGLEGTEKSLWAHGLEPIAKAHYFRGQKDIKEALYKIGKASPDVIVLVGTAEVCTSFIKNYVTLYGKTPTFYAVSFSGLEDVAQLIKDLDVKVYMTSVLPPLTENLPAIKEYVRIMKKYFPKEKVSSLSFEGFLNAKLFVEIIRKIGLSIDREKLIDTLENLKNFDIGLLEPINFSSHDHQGLKKVYFYRIKNGKIYYLFSAN
ncbi:ABC transporter substrate-binding protein [Thermodesulfatator atlanticus]